MDAELFVTSDGSHSLRSPSFGSAYHSTHGAIQESRHIFIDAGLRPLLGAETAVVTVVEMGFGTGLNALLTWQVAEEIPAKQIRYIAFERFPIGEARAKSLNYPGLLDVPPADFLRLHTSPAGETIDLSDRFQFTRIEADFLTYPPFLRADLLFYDAFAPEQQPELWTRDAMVHAAGWLRPGGRLLTYCAKGQFKRDLRAAGFAVTALPGPVGKREITRGDLIDLTKRAV